MREGQGGVEGEKGEGERGKGDRGEGRKGRKESEGGRGKTHDVSRGQIGDRHAHAKDLKRPQRSTLSWWLRGSSNSSSFKGHIDYSRPEHQQRSACIDCRLASFSLFSSSFVVFASFFCF